LEVVAMMTLCSYDSRTVYTLRDMLGESMDVVVCERHGVDMPLIDGERVTAKPADPELQCEFCPRVEP
jgi:hypothetical protein